MTRSKKKKVKIPVDDCLTENEEKKVPIENLPDNFLWMHVKSGTKIRNVLEYALKQFPERAEAIVWSGIGQAIGKTISCAELFKRKNPGLHQVTRLRSVPSKKKASETENSGEAATESDKVAESSKASAAVLRVPEIHIFLTKKPTHTKEIGYQAPGDIVEFLEVSEAAVANKSNDSSSRRKDTAGTSTGHITSLAAQEFAAMGLRTGQKRSRKEQQQTETPSKKNKKKTSCAAEA